MIVTDTAERLAALRLAEDDLKGAGNIRTIEHAQLADGGLPVHGVTLADEEPAS